MTEDGDTGDFEEPEEPVDHELLELELDLLVQALWRRWHADFRNYSPSYMKRRARRALGHFGVDTLSALQARVLRDEQLFGRVVDFLTVPTTELFRDPEYFQAVREHVVPWLRTFPSIKIWVAGCSTGEEVYSLAIVLEEEELLDRTVIYATDVNASRLEAARQGVFRTEVARKGAPAYLQAGGQHALSDYYHSAYDAVRFDPRLIKGAVFADHSLATDAVFSEVHFVSCRNVLIYFDRSLQDRAFGLFHDSLVHKGVLGLGSRETVRFSSWATAFEPLVEEQRLWRRRRRTEG